MKLKRLFAVSVLLVSMVASIADAAQWPKQRFVQMQSDAKSSLCIAVADALASAPKDVYGRLFKKLRDRQTRIEDELPIGKVTFLPPLTRPFKTIDTKGVERTFHVDYYHLDADNDGSAEMLMISSGGRGPAGDGDTLYLLAHDPSSLAQPVPNEIFVDVALEIGGPKLTFYTESGTFDPAYYIYPFAFQDRNYLLLEGNRIEDLKYLVVELVPGTGIVSRCRL